MTIDTMCQNKNPVKLTLQDCCATDSLTDFARNYLASIG